MVVTYEVWAEICQQMEYLESSGIQSLIGRVFQ